MRRLLGLAVLLFSLQSRGQEGDWLEHRLDLMNELSMTSKGYSLFNPDGLYPLDSYSNVARLNAELMARIWPEALQVRAQVGSGLATGAEHSPDFSFRELYALASFGKLELTVGRRILKWTNGYAFTPAGLLEPKRNPSDPQDRLKLREGLDVAQLDVFVGEHVVSLVFTTDAVDPLVPGDPQYAGAARGNFLIPAMDLDLAILAVASTDKSAGAATVSYVWGEALELHAEVAGSMGTSTAYPQAIVPGLQRTLFASDYLAPLKRDEARLFLRYLVGTNVTLPDGTNIIGELFHTDEGLSQREWDLLLEHAQYSADQLATGQYPPISEGYSLPAVNLLQGFRRLSGQNMRQNYGFLRISRSWMSDRLSTSILGILNTDDLSGVGVGEVSAQVRQGATLYARVSALFGNQESEYGNLGRRGSVSLGAQLTF